MIFRIFSCQTMELFILGSYTLPFFGEYNLFFKTNNNINFLLILIFNTCFRLKRLHPVRLINWISFFLFSVVVPFVYIRIFYWRWNNKTPGISDEERRFHKHRNIVSMWFNMATWVLELTATVLMVRIDIGLLQSHHAALLTNGEQFDAGK